MLKKILIAFVCLVLVLVSAGFWAYGLIDTAALKHNLKTTQKTELAYLSKDIPDNRGKILAVVTSHNKLGNAAKPVGYELTELARAYYVFEANGFSVDIASPQGGTPPQVLDGDDMAEYDYAFLNDIAATEKLADTLKLSEVNPADYQAVYFVGGKGTMFDFIANPEITQLVEHFYNDNKAIAAVCHGPAALLGAKNSQGDFIVTNKKLTAFTNPEELLLIPDAREIFGQLLQDRLVAEGAQFYEGPMYLNNVVIDDNLITGQNPWSVWKMAEATIEKLGYTPKPRTVTAEEYAVEILNIYHLQGRSQALNFAEQLHHNQLPYQRNLVFIHALMAFMQFDLLDGVGMLIFVQQLKNLG
ncbi:type 1 glutamine amidotransferase domain-containing protein [Pseudoalteromonas fenneropenaei]|uniref:Type 1 glutamine amidotransferase domain-containing protein n=1 Tax=Pseudoalteromonas fenneropenaei TaxID=1737459 RepID=A0ABV7CCA9_9GAMM